MLSSGDFIKQSLELHLFFARIMKEHSFFLEIGFTPVNSNFIRQANIFKRAFGRLLAETIHFSNGVVSPSVLKSGEVVTPYTLNAEMASSRFTGVKLEPILTKLELKLMGNKTPMSNSMLENKISILNGKAIRLISALINFKTMVLSQVLSCKIFTTNYPELIHHILQEAKFYLNIVKGLQKREKINLKEESYKQEVFWDHIMAEHAEFIRGSLDPTEKELIKTADKFADKFNNLEMEAREAMKKGTSISDLTEETIKATKEIRDFKKDGTKGILECKIRSIIIPLMADHTLREANHYLRLLKVFEESE
ncbi:DUF2935 domain-containing protein [Clostridium sp.]|uniref:DUF2935 domain-containing protein n=1 Tax=Clostridium sp. TaxID=1506 RepID=UPI0034646361